MSNRVPWDDQAQLTEFSTGTNFVGSVRECLQHYAGHSPDVKVNALLVADTAVPLPGRPATKVLEQPELETLRGLIDPVPISAPAIAAACETHKA